MESLPILGSYIATYKFALKLFVVIQIPGRVRDFHWIVERPWVLESDDSGQILVLKLISCVINYR